MSKTAKTGSKNNPLARESAAEVLYEGKKIVPVLYVGERTQYMAGQFEDGSMPLDNSKNPISWSKLKH